MKVLTAVVVSGAMLMSTSSAMAQANNPIVSNVNCGSGGSIQNALDSTTFARPLEVVVTGTCTEDLDIKRNQVTIRGAVAGSRTSKIIGSIKAEAVSRILLKDLTLEGGTTIDSNIRARLNTSMKLENLLVTKSKRAPLEIELGASVYADRSVFLGSNRPYYTIVVRSGSRLIIERSRVFGRQSGDFSTVSVLRGSVLRMQYNVRLEHNNPDPENEFSGAALWVLDNSVVRSNDGGPANAIDGNVAIEGSRADLRNVNIAGNMLSSRLSMLELRDTTTVTGRIRSTVRSVVDYKGGNHTGTLDCFAGGAVRGVPGGIAVPAACIEY